MLCWGHISLFSHVHQSQSASAWPSICCGCRSRQLKQEEGSAEDVCPFLPLLTGASINTSQAAPWCHSDPLKGCHTRIQTHTKRWTERDEDTHRVAWSHEQKSDFSDVWRNRGVIYQAQPVSVLSRQGAVVLGVVATVARRTGGQEVVVWHRYDPAGWHGSQNLWLLVPEVRPQVRRGGLCRLLSLRSDKMPVLLLRKLSKTQRMWAINNL